MQDTTFKNIYDEPTAPQGAYDIIRTLDHNIRNISNEIYVFRRETQRDVSDIKQELSSLKASDAKHDKNIDKLQNEVAELKNEVRDLRRDVSDIKGDIKALAAGFGAAQNRFNWGLIILGLFVALIQLLK